MLPSQKRFFFVFCVILGLFVAAITVGGLSMAWKAHESQAELSGLLSPNNAE